MFSSEKLISSFLTKTNELLFVLNSEVATNAEKWRMALTVSDKKAKELYETIKKREEELNSLRAMSANELDKHLSEEIKKRDELADKIKLYKKQLAQRN